MMKSCLFVFLLIALFSYPVSAQNVITPANINKHIGDTVMTFATVVGFKFDHDANISLLQISGYDSDQTSTVVIHGGDLRNFEQPSDTSFIGKMFCIAGRVIAYNGKAAIDVTNLRIRWINEVGILGNQDSTVHKRVKITNVVLAPPPNTNFSAEHYRSISLAELNTAKSDTIRIFEKVISYKLTQSSAYLYVGAAYPDQKLTIVLKGDAKRYLDAVLEIQYKGSDPLTVLDGKKILSIGKVTHLNSIPQMVVKNPGLFTVISYP